MIWALNTVRIERRRPIVGALGYRHSVQIELLTPPGFCQYAAGPCDRDFAGIKTRQGFVAYPGEPEAIAATIEAAAAILRKQGRSIETWRQISNAGKIIFCEICMRIRGSDVLVADVTTLNFNVLFELGYALGLGLPVIPIRDTSYMKDGTAVD